METTTIQMFNATVQYQDEYIWVKPVCDFFNLSVQFEYRKIKKDHILKKLWTNMSTDSGENENLYGKMSTDLGMIDANGRIFLTKKGFIRWIHIINPKNIDDDLKEKFYMYQELVFDYLYGNATEERQLRVDYTRLKKLEKLYSKVGQEIKREKKKVNEYLQNRYQMRIDYKKELPEAG